MHILQSLRVIHLAKSPLQDLGRCARLRELLPQAFFLDSCQRMLWVCWDTDLEDLEVSATSGVEVFEGIEAYRFLLRVATGLESQIVGETDIFGQLKEVWRKMSPDAEMSALMQRLFEDTKDIRSRFMQNLGGATYGSLVRMMLKQSRGPTLVIGAGQLAQSVAPYLLDQELWLFNRSPEALTALHQQLVTRDAVRKGWVRVISAEEEAMAWSKAANVVVCVPFDETKDPQRIAWREGCEGPVIHLGGTRENAGAWCGLPGFEALDDLFELQKAQGDVRMTQVRLAARACDEKSKLRTLGVSVTLPHGWEDLAIFA